MNRDHLKRVIAADRQLLALLDAQIEDLGGSVDLDDGVERVPFFYTAQGSDKAAGVLIDGTNVALSGLSNPFYGYIRMANDAPFIATHVFATVQYTLDGAIYIDPVASGMVGVRVYDESSARQLSLTQFEDTPNNIAIPSEMFTAVERQGAPLPVENEFPPGAVVRVEAYLKKVLTYPTYSQVRLHFGFAGYKVFSVGVGG